MSTTKLFRFDLYEVNVASGELHKCGVRVELQRKPFRVLELLLTRAGEVVTRDELVHYLWPDSHVGFDHSLNSAVNSLRHALGDGCEGRRLIETRPGVGYRLCTPVQEVRDDFLPAVSRGNGRNRSVHEDCVRGRYLLDKSSEDEINKAIAFFKSATEDETCSSLAHAGIADAYCQLALLGSNRPSVLSEAARSACEYALLKSSRLPEAHVAAARVKAIFDWDWKGAQDSLKQAIALDPQSLAARTFEAWLLCTFGHFEDALKLCELVLAADPLSVPANLQLSTCLHAIHNFEGAATQCWKMLTLMPHSAPFQNLLALAYEQLGMYEDALVEFGNAHLALGFEAAAKSGMGHTYALMGLDSKADQSIAELSSQAEYRYVPPFCYAIVWAGRGDEGRAISYLQESAEMRDPALLSLHADVRLDAIRMDKRFQVVVREVESGK